MNLLKKAILSSISIVSASVSLGEMDNVTASVKNIVCITSWGTGGRSSAEEGKDILVVDSTSAGAG